MTDTSVKLRDYIEKWLTQAVQQLHITLLEAKDLAKLPQMYAVY